MEIKALVPERWNDFEQLFGPCGACDGCWCMYWKLNRKDFNAGRGDLNRMAQEANVKSGRITGLLGYLDGIPVGWVAVEPRSEFPRLARSRILAPLDDQQVWSVPCFFVEARYRSQGVMLDLIKGAAEYVRSKGGKILEAYPIETGQGERMDPGSIFTGLSSAFLQAGFSEAARRSEKRPIMRLKIH